MRYIFFAVIVVFCLGWFCFVFGMIFSPKLRSKFMGHQLKMQKKMLDDNAELIEEVSTKSAQLGRKSVKTTASAVKEGFTEGDDVYCKHCGESIDNDSTFCKKCGKKQ